jgi:hypothetical protein
MFRIVFGLTSVALLLTLCATPAKAGKKKQNAVSEGTVVGTIKAVSEDGTVVTVAGPGTKKKPGPTTDVKITKATQVEYAGIENKVEQKLQVGYGVTVTLGEKDKDTAVSLKVSKTVEQPKKKNAVPEGTVIGTIKSVNEDGSLLTVEGPSKKKKKPGPTTDVKITKDTKIEYAGIENKDEQKLQVGYGVTVTLGEKDKDTAVSLKVSKTVEQPKKKKKNNI